MIFIHNEADCCGCAACAASCPNACITMEPGTLGALFPKVDLTKCIHCGRCVQVCPIKNRVKAHTWKQTAYAAYSKDAQIRFDGSSGGMFQTFAEQAFRDGFVVYGAAFDEDLKLRCTLAKSREELFPLLKSKYLQSDMQGKFSEIQRKLKSGERVMITATPCQIAALKSYLKKDYENLLTIDFFCHGVPSQKFFDECRQYVEGKEGITIQKYMFRTKIKNGATPHYFSIEAEKDGEKYRKTRLYFYSPFYAAFQKYITLRESCYACPFSGKERCSDITIGDFHSIDCYLKGINRFQGVSTVIINSEKGNLFLENCRDTLEVWGMDIGELQKNGDCFAGSTTRPKNRDAFIDAYENQTFDSVAAEFFNSRQYWKHAIYYHLPPAVRNLVKSIIHGG